VNKDIAPPPELTGQDACDHSYTRALHGAGPLTREIARKLDLVALVAPEKRNTTLAELIEDEPKGVSWHSRSETQALIDKMSEVNLARIAQAKKAGRKMVGTLYRRTRHNSTGEKFSALKRVSMASRAVCARRRAAQPQSSSLWKRTRPLASDFRARDGSADGTAGRVCSAGKIQ